MKEDTNKTGAHYWRSLDDLSETPAFKDWVKSEFPAGASELEGVNRRNFIKIMAASFGLAGLGMSGCRRPKQHILPYAKQPENLIPGVANYYCTSIPGIGANTPVIVESHQARPTKIEGNPSYTPFGGATSTHNQASILDLYDPDRATKSSLNKNKISDFQLRDALANIKANFSANGGEGLAILAEPSASPSRERLKKEWAKQYPKARWVEYSPSLLGHVSEASKAIYGLSLKSQLDFNQLDRILSVDSDFLSEGDNALAQARGFTAKRKVLNRDEASQMNRLYAVESSMTSTGAMADHRLRLSSVQMTSFLAHCAAILVRKSGASSEVLALLDSLAEQNQVEEKWLSECVADLYKNKGRSAIIIGEHLPAEAQAIAFYINQILKAPAALYERNEGGTEGLKSLVQALNKGSVDTLFVLGGNPVFDAPADFNWKTAQAKARQSVHLSYWFNETSDASDYHVAESHYLESWSDGLTPEGLLVPVQPLIDPLFETLNDLELLSSLLDGPQDAYSIVQTTFSSLGGTDFNRFLTEGISNISAYANVGRTIDTGAFADLLKKTSLQSSANSLSLSNLELRFVPSFHALEGRYANNGWMMECPDPITKLTWDNALLISPRLAKDLESQYGVSILAPDSLMNKGGAFFKSAKGELQKNSSVFKDGKESAVIVTLEVGDKNLELPIHVLPGLANYTVVLPYGMGRTLVGRVGENVGFNAYPLRQSTAMGFTSGVKITPSKNRFYLANTQEHWSMEGRAIVREGTADYYQKDPKFVSKMGVESHAPDNYGYDADRSLAEKSLNQYRGNSAYIHPKFNEPDSNVKIWKDKEKADAFVAKQQWGMALDMNTCTGCSACVVACQSENNIPIVGKDQVLRGREMHWMRLDRYFSAKEYNASEIPEDVQVSFMGMMCAHCENAPCESVCPVNATVHDKEGLNTMAYNRCVGTRYCANNCPYKVRRFNFFDWNKRQIGEFYKGPLGPVDEPELEKMRANPDVTVRMRGVMEKCTYCVQRIQSAKINQKRIAGASNDTHVPDGAIKTACQQVCPTDAISFGDISDENSEVSKLKVSDRNYSVLGYLNVRPRTTYLARLRNPNKYMPDYYKYPFAYKSYKERYGNAQSLKSESGPSPK